MARTIRRSSSSAVAVEVIVVLFREIGMHGVEQYLVVSVHRFDVLELVHLAHLREWAGRWPVPDLRFDSAQASLAGEHRTVCGEYFLILA